RSQAPNLGPGSFLAARHGLWRRARVNRRAAGNVRRSPRMTDPTTAQMIRAAIAASAEIMTVYARDFSAVSKTDGSPVTEADQRAEAVILEHLMATGIPVLGEESVAAGIVPAL